MAILTRKTQPVFASAAADIGQFGSGQLGTKVITTDPAVVMACSSGAAWAGGWLDAVLGANKFPPLEEMNGISFVCTYQLAYLFQEGIPEYDAGTTYSQFGICKKAATFQVYGSLVTNNIGNALTDPASWVLLVDLSNPTGRTRLTGNMNFYVATAGGGGSNSNTGLTIGSPWLTIQHAIDVVSNLYDLNGFSVTINVAAGTYTGGAVVNQPFTGGGAVTLLGSATTQPANCIISTTSADCISVNNGAVMQVAGFKVTATTSGNGLNASQKGYIITTGFMEYGAIPVANAQRTSTFGGEVDLHANYSISGSAPAHWSTAVQSRIATLTGSVTVTLVGTPAYSGAFALVQSQSYQRIQGATFAGTGATGNQYSVIQNSVLDTAGGLASFPGTGTNVATGGQAT